MDIDTFSNFFLAVLIGLQLTVIFISLLLYHTMGVKSLPLSILLNILLVYLVLMAVGKIKVYGNDGKLIDRLGQIFKDTIKIAVWSSISSLVLLVVGMVYAYHIATTKNMNHLVALSVPLSSIVSYYLGFWIVMKTSGKIKVSASGKK